jgi:hypothetical protein
VVRPKRIWRVVRVVAMTAAIVGERKLRSKMRRVSISLPALTSTEEGWSPD